MCIICIDLIKQKITPREALRNFAEVSTELSDKHAKQVLKKISEELLKEKQQQEEETQENIQA